ncbi:Uncharacterised protein [Salmonella enterica subsp. enterica serovar Bovismorbificans]|nr:Uncharacterised protein [Salmonella enterica subsp. enterica serovar Bovismorbificans]
MRFETIQLFRHINALRHHHQLLLQTVVFQLNLSIFQLRDQAFTLPLQDFRHMRADFRYFGADAFQPLFNQRFQRLAFRFTRHDKVIQRTVQRG